MAASKFVASSLLFFRACTLDCFDIPPQTYVECETYSLRKTSRPIRWIALVHPSKNLVGAIPLNREDEPFLTGLYVPEYKSRLKFTKRGFFWVADNSEFKDSYVSARCGGKDLLLEHYGETSFSGFLWHSVCDANWDKCDITRPVTSETGLAVGYSICKVKNLEDL